MKFVDYYKVLGLKKSASSAEIRKAYLNRAKEHHPDRGGQEQRMHKINEAYETLKDERARALYDEIHRAKYSPAPDESIFFTEMASDHRTREQLLEDTNKSLRQNGLLAAVSSAVAVLIYLYTNSNIYLAVLPLMLIAILRFSRAFYDRLSLRAKPKTTFLETRILFTCYAVAVLVVGFGAYGILARYRGEKTAVVSSAVLNDDALSKIKEARNSYESCQSEFTQVSTQLQLTNQQIDKAFVSGDQVAYSRLKNERESLVTTFANQQTKCSELQVAYNQLLNKYKVENGVAK
jgi:hypothetical protein